MGKDLWEKKNRGRDIGIFSFPEGRGTTKRKGTEQAFRGGRGKKEKLERGSFEGR